MVLEIGPKGKKVAAVAPDWPGLERGGTSADAALERLDSCRSRYAAVAERAGRGDKFAALGGLDVVETYPGVGSTDFWGISFAFSNIDGRSVPARQFEAELALMQACWDFFDGVRARVSDEMRRGPRRGGRDRDTIVRHVLVTGRH